VVTDNQPNLLSLLVKSIIPLEIPEPVIPEGSPNPDSIRWYFRYNYNKDHFWDNIDLTDNRILRTPILHSRLETFFSNIVIQSPDSINKEIDKLIKKCEPQYDMFQYVSVFLFNKYRSSEIMGHDAVLYKIAKEIYLSGKADWVSDQFLSDLEREVELMGNSLIGMRGKDLVMNSYSNFYVSLYDIKKEFTILYFWEPNCGHCKTTTPKLIEYYTEAKDDDVEIFAVCTTDNKEEWETYIQDNNITWINGWDPDRTTHFDYYYNVRSTPLIYILDREKRIIAKKLAVEDLASFISNYKLMMGE
jgi:thiol-disulfide isomerase/thioredoxin